MDHRCLGPLGPSGFLELLRRQTASGGYPQVALRGLIVAVHPLDFAGYLVVGVVAGKWNVTGPASWAVAVPVRKRQLPHGQMALWASTPTCARERAGPWDLISELRGAWNIRQRAVAPRGTYEMGEASGLRDNVDSG